MAKVAHHAANSIFANSCENLGDSFPDITGDDGRVDMTPWPSLSLTASWDIECQYGTTTVPSTIIFSWLTGCLSANTTTYSNYIPVIDSNHLYGEYTRPALRVGRASR